MCMCDIPNEYVCFECECFYKDAIKELIHTHKNDILDTNDWWWTINDFDINMHCSDEDAESPDAIFNINLYKLDRETTSSYEARIQWDIEPMTRKEIRLL